MSAPVLDVVGVTKAFGDREVLRGVSLSVPEHGAVALIGASGSGKSTLLRCIDLLEEIDDGDVLLDGAVVTDPSVEPVAVRRSLGMVFQAFNLFPHLTALENVALVATLGPLEAFRQAQIAASSDFNYTPLIAAALLYLCVTIPLARVLDHMQRRSR